MPRIGIKDDPIDSVKPCDGIVTAWTGIKVEGPPLSFSIDYLWIISQIMKRNGFIHHETAEVLTELQQEQDKQ